MKKILISLALILSVTVMGAQPKNPADAVKAIDKATAATQDAKKGLKPATWINLAKSYVDAYELPTRNIIVNTPQMEVKLFLKDQKVLSSEENVKCTEGLYTIDHYADKDLYYNESGVLEFWQVTKPAVEGELLVKAAEALYKASELDVKGQKAKDIVEQLENIHQKIHNDALSYYLAGDFSKSARLFEQSIEMTDNNILNRIDTIDVYYAGMINAMAGNSDASIDAYRKCINMGFYQDGNVFSNLADIYKQKGDNETRKAVLEEGFEKYPQSQGVLVGLINLYVESGDDPQKLFDLLHTAQQNEPGNASLYYVEGNIYKNLGDVENAANLFRKSSEIDPNYVFGILGVGMLYYDNAVDIQNKANEEFDDAKYMALVKQFEESLESAIEPFEKAFSMTQDHDIQAACAEYLKNIYFRFRDKNPDYAAAYEKYNKFLQGE